MGPRTLRWDLGPKTLKWDPMVGPYGGTLRWDPTVGPYSGTLRWDAKVGLSGGTLRWDPKVRRKSSHLQLFLKISVLKHSAIFTGKHLCWNLLLINETPTQVFSFEHSKIFEGTTLAAASGDVSKTIKPDGMKINCLNPAFVNGCNA